MCIHHYYLHLPCNHTKKNLKRSLLSHCPDVDRALRYYHDQPKCVETTHTLSTPDGPKHPLPTPTTCPEIWPTISSSQPTTDLASLRSWYEHTLTTHPEDSTQTLTYQTALSTISHQTLGRPAPHPNPSTTPYPLLHKPPYPHTHLSHLQSLLNHQSDPTNTDTNILIHPVPWGCGLTESAPCMHGHEGGAYCPWLLAHRLRTCPGGGEGTFAKEALGDMEAVMRGGRGCDPWRGEGRVKEMTGAAVLAEGVGGGMLVLEEGFLRGVGGVEVRFTGRWVGEVEEVEEREEGGEIEEVEESEEREVVVGGRYPRRLRVRRWKSEPSLATVGGW